MSELVGQLLEAKASHAADQRLAGLGEKMFDMYTAQGFPPDMFLDELKKRLNLTKSELIFIISEYQTKFLEHRRKSGIDEKRVEAIRRRNREDMSRFIETNELGVY